MIRKASERIVEKPQHKFGAPGFITVRQLVNDPAELNGKGRIFSHITVLPGSGIGYHIHVGDGEIYYVISGKGEYNDNGAMTTIEAGDVTFCPPGAGHGVLCAGNEPLELIALVLFE